MVQEIVFSMMPLFKFVQLGSPPPSLRTYCKQAVHIQLKGILVVCKINLMFRIFITTRQQICGKVMFSVKFSVCSQEFHMTITYDALDLTLQGLDPEPPPPCTEPCLLLVTSGGQDSSNLST